MSTGRTGEPLTGRKVSLLMLPVAQLELRNLKNRAELRESLESFLVYGSYPEVVTAESAQEKRALVTEIVGSYLLKDVLELERVKNAKVLLDLLRLVAFQVGSEVSLRELGTQLGLDYKTVARYLDLLEKGFVLFNVRGFSRNLRKEVSKKSKYYFYDNGMRNAVIANFNALELRDDVGALWENFLISERVKRRVYRAEYANQFFWRTWDGREIDLVEERAGRLDGFELKWGRRTPSCPKDWRETYPEVTWTVVTPESYLDFVLYRQATARAPFGGPLDTPTPTDHSTPMGGPLYQSLLKRTDSFGFVREYLAGSISRDEFRSRVAGSADEIEAAGLSAFEIKKLSMLPPDDRVCAAGMLEAMAAAVLVDDASEHAAVFGSFWRVIEQQFRHLENRLTSIFPEEARAAFELSIAIRPKKVVICGAYYNYLAVWLVPGLDPDGRMLCLDIDRSVSKVGRANMQRLGFADRVDTVCRDAEKALLEGEEPIDLLVIDAYGPTTHPDRRYHGKSIYGPLLAAARPRMPSGAWILAHNADPGSPLLEEFFAGVSDATFAHYLGTTEDLAVFRLP